MHTGYSSKKKKNLPVGCPVRLWVGEKVPPKSSMRRKERRDEVQLRSYSEKEQKAFAE